MLIFVLPTDSELIIRTSAYLGKGVHASAFLAVVPPFTLILSTPRVQVRPQPLLVLALPLTVVYPTILMPVVLGIATLTC
jgi:hypothetical protein